MNIDWSKAPEGATGFAPKINPWENPLWYKKDAGGVLYFTNAAESGPWQKSNCPSDNIIWRREWPEEGLPPVGMVCEVDYCESWHKCEIIAHFQQRFGMVAAFTVDLLDGAKSLDAFGRDSFRPIRTPEQIAAEERKQAAQEMFDIFHDAPGLSVEEGFAALYDAGYRKIEIVEVE